MLFSTPHDFCEIPCNSAGDSFPAPGRSRSITNFGISSSAKDGEITSLTAQRSTLGRGSQIEPSDCRRFRISREDGAVDAHPLENPIAHLRRGRRLTPWI